MKRFNVTLMILCIATPLIAADKPLYENNFDSAEVGKLPDSLMSLNGEFTVKEEGTNRFLELPGTPVDNFALQFGPAQVDGVSVSARIFGTAKGRRLPTFGIGLGGVSGFKLQVSPGKKALEIFKDADIKTGVPYDWKPGEWLMLRLQVRKAGDNGWKVEGKVWSYGSAEPKEWMVTFGELEEPPGGKASIIASPISGTPIRFDDLTVEKIEGK